MDSDSEPTAVVAAALDHEMDLVRQAIAMVAGGGSRRVTLANLRLANSLLEPARRLASDAGVRLVPLWMPDDEGLDFAIERIDG